MAPSFTASATQFPNGDRMQSKENAVFSVATRAQSFLKENETELTGVPAPSRPRASGSCRRVIWHQ
jgi:hypothetical protein